MHAHKKTCLHVNISWSIQKEIHLWITPFDKHHLCLSELMCLLCRKVSCFIHQELLLATDVYITWITNAHHCPLLKSFYIIRNQSKHAYLHSLNSKNGNQGCLVKSIAMNLPQTLRTGDHHFQQGSLADQRFLSWVQGLRGINWENAQAPD